MIPRWNNVPPRSAFSAGPEVGEALRHVDVLDHVVDAAGGPQAEDVPVVDQLRLLDRQHEDARLAGVLDDSQGVDPLGVLDADAKLHDPDRR